MTRRIGFIEQLEKRLTLSATSIDGRPFVDIGPSDNVAWDQPRVTVQLLTEDVPDGTDPSRNVIVGPNTFNTWLLDTGANTTLAFQTAVSDMKEFDPKYETDGQFNELGVGGSQLFDVSIPYRFDFAGSATFERNKLLDASIISNPNSDVSIFGPWGIVGMPAMTERVTTLDFTPWTTLDEFALYMESDFSDTVPEPLGPRYTISVDNRTQFSPEGSLVSGENLPMWADLPFLTGQLSNNESLAQGDFLFDTGAQVSIISSQLAFDLGLDSNQDGVLDEKDANFARQETVGGIGGTSVVPVFLIDEVHIPTDQGPDLVWTDLQWLILDIVPGIDGVFGFDNMTSGWIEAFGVNDQSGYLLQSHLDFRGWGATGQGKIHFDVNPDLHTLIDPGGPGAIVSESGGITVVSENGVTDTYEIRLSQPPLADVTVNFEGSLGQVRGVDAANPDNTFVMFSPSNWNIPQTVEVTAIDDTTEESYHRTFIRNISSSSDPAYDAVGMPRISVGIIDDDFPGVMIIPTDGQTHVTEGGASDYYDLVLSMAPGEDVSIALEHVANQLVAVNDATGEPVLTFTPANWNVPQRVRVTAVDDALLEGAHFGYVTHRINTSDEGYQQAFVLQEKVFIADKSEADTQAPTITNVIAGSSAWNASFIDVVDTQGVGADNGLGISLVGAHQLDNLPWGNVDRLYIEFSEDVSNTFNLSNVKLIGGNISDYQPTMNLSYASDGSNIGTIELSSAIANDAILLSVLSTLTDAAGNALDGEWIDSTSLSSGNGTAGGTFNFRIDLLPGDVNNSDGVNLQDVLDVYARNSTIVSTAEQSKLDVDGTGGVNLADMLAVYANNNSILPPAPAPSSNLGLPPTSPPGSKLPDFGRENDFSGIGAARLLQLEGYGGVSQAETVGFESSDSQGVTSWNPFVGSAARFAFGDKHEDPLRVQDTGKPKELRYSGASQVPLADSVPQIRNDNLGSYQAFDAIYRFAQKNLELNSGQATQEPGSDHNGDRNAADTQLSSTTDSSQRVPNAEHVDEYIEAIWIPLSADSVTDELDSELGNFFLYK